MTDSRNGYAIVQHDRIQVYSVSETRRAALVNWLGAGPPKLRIINSFTDAMIEQLWSLHRHGHDAKVAIVNIQLKEFEVTTGDAK